MPPRSRESLRLPELRLAVRARAVGNWLGSLPWWVQVVLVWVGAVAAVPLALGWRTRWVAPVT